MEKIAVIMTDLLFKTRINSILQSANFLATYFDSINLMTTHLVQNKPSLVIADLESVDHDFTKVAEIKKLHGNDIYFVGYCPHVKRDLIRKARHSGFDKVLSRSKIISFLSDFLKSFDKLNK